MQSATVIVSPSVGWFQSFGQTFADSDGITPIAIHALNNLADGTGLLLYELAGDPARIRRILAEDDDTDHATVSESLERTFAQIRFEPSDPVRQFQRLLQTRRISVEMPMEFTDDGGLRMTAVGPGDVLSDVFGGSSEDTTVSVEAVGDYQPAVDRPFECLSDRQQEVLRVAVEMGYFEEPRQVTQAELAAVLDVSRATVGSHLRRIQCALLPALVPESEPGTPPQRDTS